MSHTLTKSVPALAPTTSFVQRVQQYFATRRALMEVRSLDERMLRDIGLDQAQVEAAVRGKL
ncbi:MAG: DUF1127 domain-containing protein [Rhodospirillales bacterium]|nr:DUF1127 domain-containing protein [Rhodospirillales bacterium]